MKLDNELIKKIFEDYWIEYWPKTKVLFVRKPIPVSVFLFLKKYFDKDVKEIRVF